MTYYQVYDDVDCKVLYRTDSGMTDAINWMMLNVENLLEKPEIKDGEYIVAEEWSADGEDDELVSWASIADVLLDAKDHAYTIPGKRVVRLIGEETIKVEVL